MNLAKHLLNKERFPRQIAISWFNKISYKKTNIQFAMTQHYVG